MNDLAEKLVPRSGTTEDDFAGLRQRARRALMQYGFPDLKTEAWKYTPIRLLEKRDFTVSAASLSSVPDLPFAADVLHFDNGILDPAATRLPEGVRLEPASIDDFSDVDYGGREDAFAWLNLACFAQAWRLRIETPLERPLVLALTTAEDFSATVHPR